MFEFIFFFVCFFPFFACLGSSWGIGCAMTVVLAGAGALAKYTGVYKHPFPTDRMYS